MKQGFMRVAIILVAVFTLGLTAGAVVPDDRVALLPPVAGCQERTVGNAGQDWLYWSWEMMGHSTGSFRVSTGCSHQIKFRSDGWRFEGTACGDMRVHFVNSNGSTQRRTPWVRVCGGTRFYTLASFLPTNQRFELEGRAADTSQRREYLWWMGEFRF